MAYGEAKLQSERKLTRPLAQVKNFLSGPLTLIGCVTKFIRHMEFNDQ